MKHPMIVGLVALVGVAFAAAPEDPRVDMQEGVLVEVALVDPEAAPSQGVLTWDVALEMHAGDLRPLDLESRASLHAEDGTELSAAFAFEVTADSAHHPAGRLTLDPSTVDPSLLRVDGPDGPKWRFTLVLHDVGGAAERRFDWTLPLAEESTGFRAYVSNAADGTISVIDLDDLVEVERWTIGEEASHGLALLPDGRTLYAGTGAAGTILAVDTRDGTILSRTESGVNAHGIDGTPDGSHVFAGAGGTNDEAHLLRIDTRTGASTHVTEGLDPVGHIDVSPDGTRLYVANLGTDSLTVLDARTLDTIDRVAVGDGPNESRATPDGAHVVVANWNSSDVSIVDADSLQVVRTLTVGEGTHGVAVTPDGAQAWIVNRLSNDVAVLDTRTWELVDRLEAAAYANHVTFTPDGALALVTNARANELTIFDVASRTHVATIPVGAEPHEVAVGATPFLQVADAGGAR